MFNNKKGINSKSCQTTEVTFSSTQFPTLKKETATQTRPYSKTQHHVEYDLEKVQTFLHCASNIILNELENDCLSQVYTIYNGYFVEDNTHNLTTMGTEKLFEIESLSFRLKQNAKSCAGSRVEERLKVAQVDWNSTGCMLIVVYGNRGDNGLSKTPGLIEVWDISKTNEATPEKPFASLDYESELNSVAAHPQDPNIFATGSKNGEIVVFYLNDNYLSLYAVSNIGEYFHDAAITCLTWHYDKTEKSWLIYSTGLDSKLMLWSLSNNLSYPVRGYFLNSSQKREQNSFLNSSFVGNTIFTFNNNERTVVSVGCDCGHLLTSRCDDNNLQTSALKFSLKWSFNAQEIVLRMLVVHRDEVIKKAEHHARLKKKKGVDRNTLYAIGTPANIMYPPFSYNLSLPHWGNIHSVDFCNGSLLSCGEDGYIQVYTIDDDNKLEAFQKIENSFSPQKAIAAFCSKKIIVVCCEDGKILIHDQRDSTQLSVRTLVVSEIGDNISYLKFNRLTKKLAVVSQNGPIALWQFTF